jgi:hypothetical protein
MDHGWGMVDFMSSGNKGVGEPTNMRNHTLQKKWILSI